MANAKRIEALKETLDIVVESLETMKHRYETDAIYLQNERRGLAAELERLKQEELAELVTAVREDPSFVSISAFRPLPTEDFSRVVNHWVGVTATEMIGYEDASILWRSPIA